MSGRPMISFAIVNWRGGSIFEQCLASIAAEVEANQDLPCEVVVVDNGSTHEEIRFLYKYPFVRVIRNDRNVGYAIGTNQSLGRAAVRWPRAGGGSERYLGLRRGCIVTSRNTSS